jgi:phage/plasmid-associated DNA primase
MPAPQRFRVIVEVLAVTPQDARDALLTAAVKIGMEGGHVVTAGECIAPEGLTQPRAVARWSVQDRQQLALWDAEGSAKPLFEPAGK